MEQEGRIVAIAFCALAILSCTYYIFDRYRLKLLKASMPLVIFAAVYILVNLLNISALVIFGLSGSEGGQYRIVSNLQNFASAFSFIASIQIIYLDLKILSILIWLPELGVTEKRIGLLKTLILVIYGLCFVAALSFDIVYALNLPDGVPVIFNTLSYYLSAAWVILSGALDLFLATTFSILIISTYVKKRESRSVREATFRALVSIVSILLIDSTLLGIFLYSNGNQDPSIGIPSLCITNALIPIHPIILQYMYKAIRAIFRQSTSEKELDLVIPNVEPMKSGGNNNITIADRGNENNMTKGTLGTSYID